MTSSASIHLKSPSTGEETSSATGEVLNGIASSIVTDEAARGIEESPTILSKSLRNRPSGDNDFANLLRGRKLAHFELQEPLGVGGMAAVIRAMDLQLDRPVALKILPPENAAEQDNIRRFQQEARAAAKLDHENIARVYYFGEDQGLHFIAFEYVEGQNLRTMVERQGRIPFDEAVHYVLQIATGLVHAAERNVVHRDIKPSNIIVEASGRAKLVDMGLARSLDTRNDEGLTQSGVTLGTFDYISPEQALEPRDADVRSDIYSLGCTFYHLLTGQPPVPDGTAARKLQFHQHGSPIDPRELTPDIPDEVAAILSKMMAKNPNDRYQLPEQLVQHLLAISQQFSGPGQRPVRHQLVYADAILPPPPRTRPFATFAIAAAAVVFLVGALSMFSHSDPLPSATKTGASIASSSNQSTETAAPTLSELDLSKLPKLPAATNGKTRTVPVDEQPPPWVGTVVNQIAEIWNRRETASKSRSETPRTSNPLPVETPPMTPTAIANPRQLIVDGKGGKPGTFSNLANALSESEAAKVEEEVVITISRNGSLPLRPQEIGNRKVTIRAAPGFSPELVFNPDTGPGSDGDAAMFLLRDGELSLEGIQVRLQPLREPTKLLSVATVTGIGRCRLKGCLITLQGDAERRMAVIALADPTGAMMGTMGRPKGFIVPYIGVEDCFTRGQGDFVTVRVSRPYQMDVENVLVALNGSFLNVDGNKQGGTMPASVSLKRLTAYLSQHLIAQRVSTSNSAHVRLDITNAESCLFVAADGKPLFYLEGLEDKEELKRRLGWQGRQNIYSSSSDYVLVNQPQGTMMMASRYSRSEWEKLWGQLDDQARFVPIKFNGFSAGPRNPAETIPADFQYKLMEEVIPNFQIELPPGADLERLPTPLLDPFESARRLP